MNHHAIHGHAPHINPPAPVRTHVVARAGPGHEGDASGQFEGTVFHQAGLHARRHPAPRAARRPMNRPGPQGAPQGDEEHRQPADAAPLSGRARRLIDQLDNGLTPDGEGRRDDGDDDQRQGEERRTGTRFRALSGAEARAAREHSRTPLPLATGPHGSAAALARQALAWLEHSGGAARPLRLRAAMLRQVRALLEAAQDKSAKVKGLAGVRELLIDSARHEPREPAASECARDLRCLLPIVLFNLSRPRTRLQTDRAVARLHVLTRAS
jgi:hypothetical protein